MDANELAALIRDLASADAATRSRAAACIFRSGADTAQRATMNWLENRELRQLFLSDQYGLVTTVGVAVGQDAFEAIRQANGSPGLADVPPDQDAMEFELEFGRGVRLDVLTSREPSANGAIARFLKKLGEGIQQIEFEVRDVRRVTDILQKQLGIQPIYPAARDGADGTRVNFFLVTDPQSRRVLVELVQSASTP